MNNNSVGVAVLGLATVMGRGSRFDVDPMPERNTVVRNQISGNGLAPDARVTEAGFAGADLLWDLNGEGNIWDQPEATRLPYVLPGPEWSNFGRRAHERFWRILTVTQ